jgi:hypothetical protein
MWIVREKGTLKCKRKVVKVGGGEYLCPKGGVFGFWTSIWFEILQFCITVPRKEKGGRIGLDLGEEEEGGGRLVSEGVKINPARLVQGG